MGGFVGAGVDSSGVGVTGFGVGVTGFGVNVSGFGVNVAEFGNNINGNGLCVDVEVLSRLFSVNLSLAQLVQ